MKMYFLLCLALCISVLANAQATDLVIDCQTPGWLSSKINYGDQQTVRNLKVTGYINKNDLVFIGSLTQYQLQVINLGDANIIGNSWDGTLGYNFHIQKLVLPKSLISYKEASGLSIRTEVDTMVFDTQVNKIALNYVSSLHYNGNDPTLKRNIGHLIIGENVDSIEIIENVKTIHFPTSLRYLGKYSCQGHSDLSGWNIKEFPKLEYIGYCALVNRDKTSSIKPESNGETLPDSMFFPSIKEYCMSCIEYKEGMHIFFGDQLKNIFRDGIIGVPDLWHATIKNVSFHFKDIPETGGFYDCDSSVKIYIPKGTMQKWIDAGYDQRFTIIEEDQPLEGIEIDKSEVTLEVNETIQLSASPIPYNADENNIIWNSDNKEIATVNDTGLVTAIAPGTANIIAMSSDGLIRDTCKVKVNAHAESVVLSATSIIFSSIGDTQQLLETVLPSNAIDKSVVWDSSNEQVCTVSANGLVTAVGAGSSVITVTTVDGGHTANCVVKVIQHVSTLTLDKRLLTLKVGEMEQVRITLVPDNADDKSVIWSSSDNHVATIDDNGNITALKAGEAWIKAVSLDNSEAKDSCKVKVVQPVTGISLSQENYRLTNIGENVQLEATVSPADATNKEVKWTSSNEAVCVVSNGKVIATGFGTAVVLAITVDGGFMASCTVIVEKESVTVTSVTISQTSATLSKGETLQLYATALPDDATNKTLVWKSSDEEICVVTQSGLLIAMNEGKAVITVVPQYGAGQAQCSVTVWNEVTTIEDIQIDHQSNAPIYDVAGRKVSRVVKNHLYIQNGKKFIAK